MRKCRRVVRENGSCLQGYQIFLIALLGILMLIFGLNLIHILLSDLGLNVIKIFCLANIFLWICALISSVLFLIFYFSREKVSTINLPEMNKKARKKSKKIRRLFSDKVVADILGLAVKTRYGVEMPEVAVFLENDLHSGFIAVENIGNYDVLNRSEMEQKVSGILSGKWQKYAVTSSELIRGDTYVLYRFEDCQTSMRFIIKRSDEIADFVSSDNHELRLAKDLVWHCDKVPHLAIIARTRAGKSVFAGAYLAPLMIMQGWKVEYNSAKSDIYVKKYRGKSEPTEIVERAEYWVSKMEGRLRLINKAGAEKYTDMPNMGDIAVFFDELGNLNASLEHDKKLKTRWEMAINRLSATGASAGLHIISISQRATREGFLTGLARTNSSDAVIMLGGAASSPSERQYLIPGFEIPTRSYGVGQGIAKVDGSGKRWETPHYYETPLFKHYV